MSTLAHFVSFMCVAQGKLRGYGDFELAFLYQAREGAQEFAGDLR